MASNKKKGTARQETAKHAASTSATPPSKADAKTAKPVAKATKADAKAAKAKAKANKAKAKAKKNGKPGFGQRVSAYFSGVRSEVKRVVWPTRDELVKYSVAVIVMLVFFGVLIYLVDSAIVPLLVAFTGLRG